MRDPATLTRDAQILYELALDGHHRGLPSVPRKADHRGMQAWAARHVVNGWRAPERLPRAFVLRRSGR